MDDDTMPKFGEYAEEAIRALVKGEILRGPDKDVHLERVHSALSGIGWAILSLSSKPAVTEMLDHCAITDHVLELRLIDTEVFGVRCTGPECSFRTEWRT